MNAQSVDVSAITGEGLRIDLHFCGVRCSGVSALGQAARVRASERGNMTNIINISYKER